MIPGLKVFQREILLTLQEDSKAQTFFFLNQTFLNIVRVYNKRDKWAYWVYNTWIQQINNKHPVGLIT